MSQEGSPEVRGGPGVAAHYNRLAPDFTRHWSYSDTFVDWMTGRLVAHTAIGADSHLLDVGSGPALYSRRLAEHTRHPVVCVDPSAAMLTHIPDTPRLVPVHATAQAVARGEAELPHREFDAILVKEALHHVPRGARGPTVRGLASLLAPHGRLVVVMMPTHDCGHPLFSAALRKLGQARFTPETVAGMLADSGRAVHIHQDAFPVTMPTARYLDMVGARYLTLLEHFTDTELDAGVTEIRRAHPGDTVTFTDRYTVLVAH
ncbi:class I SAM-dependent methyltransferase [Saccharomonospora saliphila]|uniref:class I SAM-dependent methyltransferase n=1 Tax=Saccharomonospora saliphila TaxID=369829 RepID=UPI00037C809D|nr:class I SAM-dependent methyltransferase [Saccharomonospora saliphila]